ncbi:Dna-J like membrane chaperone protein [bacterium BMS3Abin03]|nr:Dna-J like membrane chaperone protein [bacterium BMS3Abin03]
MHIPIKDRSSYLKGLLVVAKKDNELHEREKDIIREIAKSLGFSPTFYEYTIKNLLSNEYINDDPIIFSDKMIAKSFIIDGLRMAKSDNKLDDNEISWLRDTTLANGMDTKWFEQKLKETKSSPRLLEGTEFALYNLI